MPTLDRWFLDRGTHFRRSTRLLALVGLLVSLHVPGVTMAQEGEAPARTLILARGTSTVVDHPANLERVSIGDPEVADAVVVSSREVVVNGKAPGSTTLLMWDEAGSRRLYDVRVTTDVTALSEQIDTLFPDEDLQVQTSGGTVILSGTTRDPEVARKSLVLAQNVLGEDVPVMDHIAVPDRGQILLKVRFAEVNRSALQQYGFNFLRVDPNNIRGDDEGTIGTGGVVPFSDDFLGGAGGGQDLGPNQTFSDAVNFFIFHDASNVSAFIRALRSRGVFRSLAEPNLLAMPGEEASFLAGGEFPFPVLQGGAAANAVTIEFKEFGIRLNFLPTLANSGAIRLKVEPEVSTLDFANGLQLGGFRVPSVLSRRANTVVELADGQTFAIAGLIDNQMTKNVNKVPLLGDIPILGSLFRSEEMRQNKTELLVLVTPQIVRPQDQAPPLPTGEPENWNPKEDLKRPFPGPGEPVDDNLESERGR